MPAPAHRARRPLGVALVGLVVLSGAAWFAGTRIQSPDEAAARANAPEASLITAPVERRRLEATLITRGDVRPASVTTVSAPSSVDDEPVVTAVGAEVGQAVSEGTVLVEVSGRPVFVLQGAVPAYRAMRPGSAGPDVAQLQAALRRLGHAPESDGTYGPATKRAVAALYASAGYEPPASADDEPITVAAAQQRVRAAAAAASSAEQDLGSAAAGPTEEEIAQADAAVASAQRAHGLAVQQRESSVSQADADARVADRRCQRLRADPSAEPDSVDEACTERDRSARASAMARSEGDVAVADAADGVRLAELARADLDRPSDLSDERRALRDAREEQLAAAEHLAEVERSTGTTVPRGEVVFVPSTPARVERLGPPGSPGAAGGGEGEAPAGLAILSSGGLEVVASVPARDLAGVQTGDRVELLDEASGEERPALVAAIDAEPSPTDGEPGGHRIQLIPDEQLPEAWFGRNIRVTLTSAATAGEVLVVPLAAISSRADGDTRVHRLGADGTTREVAVTAGLSADGFVEVRPQGRLRAGDRVVVGR